MGDKHLVILSIKQASVHNYDNESNFVVETCSNPRGVGDFIDDLMVVPGQDQRYL